MMENRKMDQTDLLMGLAGMSQAIHWNNMSGHPPAAVIAAYYFCQENNLEGRVQAEVQRWVEIMMRGSDSIWHRQEDGSPVTNAGLFEHGVEGTPDPSQVPGIAKALEHSIDSCRASGHNTIFASLSLKALHSAPAYAYPSVIAGIVQLIEDFVRVGPGYAHVPGQDGVVDARQLAENLAFDLPDYESTADMVAAVCEHVTVDGFTRRGLGGPIHVINHAVALLDLQTLGYAELVQRGLAAQHEHLRLWLALPPFPESENVYIPTPHDPRTYDYWAGGIELKDRGGYEHRLKFLYGTHRFAAHIPDEDNRRAFMQTAYHLL